MIIFIPASLLRGFEEALLAAVPEPSYLLMPTIATRCWQHVEDLSNRLYYQNQCWCKWWSFHCLNPQLPQKAANGPHGGSAATMGPGDHWEQVFLNLVDLVGCSWWWGSNICWWHRPFFGRRLLVVFNRISLAWITKRRLEFPGTKSPFPLSPQLQREVSS